VAECPVVHQTLLGASPTTYEAVKEIAYDIEHFSHAGHHQLPTSACAPVPAPPITSTAGTSPRSAAAAVHPRRHEKLETEVRADLQQLIDDSSRRKVRRRRTATAFPLRDKPTCSASRKRTALFLHHGSMKFWNWVSGMMTP
jgi:hypothetical protein